MRSLRQCSRGQGSSRALIGVHPVVHSHQAPAPTHEIGFGGSRALNYSYTALLEHCGLSSLPGNPGRYRE